MNLRELLNEVDRLRDEIDGIRPIDPIQEQRIMQKFRLDWTYHSNAIEGNSLNFGETRAFLLHGITAQGKPFRDYLDIKGHHEALDYLSQFIQQNVTLTEAHIRELHRIIMVEPKRVPAMTPQGQPTTRLIAIGQYKTAPNHVQTSTGEMHFYASPEETPAKMGNLIRWYRRQLNENLHPLILAATFHYEFVSIHPFDDGNGRMARILMNLMLMQAGYVPVIIETTTKESYLLALEQADAGDIEPFILHIGKALLSSLNLYLRGARGESIEQLSDLDKRLLILKKKLAFQANRKPDPTHLQRISLWLNDFLVPFIEHLTTELTKFDEFFDRVHIQIRRVVERTSYPINGKLCLGLEDKLTLINTSLNPQILAELTPQKLSILYGFYKFANTPLNVNVLITLELLDDSFKISAEFKELIFLEGEYQNFPIRRQQTKFISEITSRLVAHLNQIAS